MEKVLQKKISKKIKTNTASISDVMEFFGYTMTYLGPDDDTKKYVKGSTIIDEIKYTSIPTLIIQNKQKMNHIMVITAIEKKQNKPDQYLITVNDPLQKDKGPTQITYPPLNNKIGQFEYNWEFSQIWVNKKT